MKSAQEVYVQSRRAAGVMRPGDDWIIGSGAGCDLRVADSGVSDRHCRLRHLGARVRIESVDHRTPVRIAGAEVESAVFPLAGAFQLGDATVQLRPGKGPGPEVLPGMVGCSPAIRLLGERVARAAEWSLPVLVRGESGSGKDLVARAIHALGPRASESFIAVNGGSLDPMLAASTLFGHERGAFTGAAAPRLGAIRKAHRGTLFIDEVASLASEVQTTLLRVLEEGAVHPLGADAGVAVDVRIVAATCESLEADVARGRFRADLYQRLAACVIRVPALRERRDDVAPIARHLLASIAPGYVLTESAIDALERHRFPGNVRELRNVLCQATLEAEAVEITAEDVAAAVSERVGERVERVEPTRATGLLAACRGNVSEAARRAGVARSTFRDALKRAQKAPPSERPCVSSPSVGITRSADASLSAVSTK